MATQNILFGSEPGNNEIDLIDIAALVLLPLFTSIIFGVFSWQIEVFGGYDFTAPLWTLAGIDISAALLVVVASVGWIVLTNVANQQTDMGQYEAAVVIVTLALPILYVFVPAVEGLVTWHDLMRLAATLWVMVGAVYVSYVG